MKRVVITGMGIWSCLGTDIEQVRESLRTGLSGVGIDPVRAEFGYQSPLTGMVPEAELKGLIDRRARLCMPQQAGYAFMSTRQALAQAGIDEGFLTKNEVGILFGNDSTAQPVIEGVDIIREKRNTALVGSGNVFQSMNSTVSMNLSVIFNLRGVNFTIAGACASGSHAIGMAYLLIKNGLQDCIVCGGAQEVNIYAVGSFDALSAFSARVDAPEKASRPFDKDRDGLVPGGGAATLVVESLESAQARGAHILGEIVGYGFSSNGQHISVPNVEGPTRSLQMALRESGLPVAQIGYVNAHATSTPVGDYNEALAIDSVFGNHKPLVTSTKSQTGHEMWMAGASEVVYSLLMMHGGFVAANLNFEQGDEASQRLNIPAARVDTQFDTFLSNSFGFGGTNSTLIIKR